MMRTATTSSLQDQDAVLPSPVSTSSSRSTVSTSPDSYLATPESHLASLSNNAAPYPIAQHQPTSQDTLHPQTSSFTAFSEADANNSLLFYFNDQPALFDDGRPPIDLSSSPFGVKTDSTPTTSFNFSPVHAASPSYSGANPQDFLADGGASHARMTTSEVQALFSAPRLTVSFPSQEQQHQQQQGVQQQHQEDGKRRRTTLLSSPTANVIKLEQENMHSAASLDGASSTTTTPASATSPMQASLRKNTWNGGQTPSSNHSTPSLQAVSPPYGSQQQPPMASSSRTDLSSTASANPLDSSATAATTAAAAESSSSATSEVSTQIKKRERQDTGSPPSSQQDPTAQQSSSDDAQDANFAKVGHEVIWTDEVEVAFWEALRLIPKLGARKVMMHNKACGRNELIAAYILRKTGLVRTRKQVSSHLQVLKRLRDRDREVFELLADPIHDWEFYIPAGGAVYTKTLAGYGLGGEEGPYPIIPADKDVPRTEDVASVPDSIKEELKMLRHVNPSPVIPMSPSPQLRRAMPSVRASPALSSNEGLMAPPLSAGGRLALAMDELQIPSPGLQRGGGGGASQNISPILPASFAMWAHTPQQDARHVYAVLDTDKMLSCARGTSTLPQLPLDRVRIGVHRFPGLVAMHARLPCQFLHMHVPLCLPRMALPNKSLRYNQFSTQLTLTSVDDTPLTAVTTVYSHGKRLLTLVEPLAAPRKTNAGGSASRHASPNLATVPLASPLETPQSAVSASGAAGPSPARHRYVHQAPFATDFWADFLSRPHPVHIHAAHPEHAPPPAFTKPARERAAVGMAVSGISVIQEFVVASEEKRAAGAGAEGADISPGSSVGAVVLVVAWDLEYVQTLGTEPGSPSVSVLVSPISTQGLERSVYNPGRSGQQQQHQQQQQRVFQGQSVMQRAPMPMSSQSPLHGGFAGRPEQSSLLRKRGISMMKPNLIVAIPPVPAYLSGRVDGVEGQAHPHTAQHPRGPPLGSAGGGVGLGLGIPQHHAHGGLRSAPPQQTMAWGEMQQHALDQAHESQSHGQEHIGALWAQQQLQQQQQQQSHSLNMAPQPQSFPDAHVLGGLANFPLNNLSLLGGSGSGAGEGSPGIPIPYGLVSQVDPTFGQGISSPEMAQLQAGHALLTRDWNLGLGGLEGVGAAAGAQHGRGASSNSVVSVGLGSGLGQQPRPQGQGQLHLGGVNGTEFDLQQTGDFADMYATMGFVPFHPHEELRGD